MSLPTLSIRRPVLSIVMSLVIIIFGVIGFKSLGVREFPAIDPPVITVSTNYKGANAEVIESQITEPLEKAINGIQGIRSISSTSALGNSQISVEFNLNTDLETAANDVRDKVSQTVRLLPQDIDALPTVTKSDASGDPILSMTVSSDTRNILDLSDYAENVIAQRLQTIPEVSSVQIWGQKKYAMRLWIDPNKLAAYGLTLLDVQNALHAQNVDLPGGKIEGYHTELNVNTHGQLVTSDDFNNMILKTSGTQTVKMRDVGYAMLGAEQEETNLKFNGVPMIGVAVVPQPGANYINISNEFYKRKAQLEKEVPKDIQLGIAMDNTQFIRKSVKEVGETIGIAALLVIMIIFLFFREWIIAIRPLIDLPVSLIGAFFIMYIMNYSINVLTLLAIVLATGLVVDDGIVVTENIFKRIEKGMKPRQAAIEGSNEILFVVISTSLTLIVVFMPVIFLQGFVGKLFQEFGVVLAGAVLISAFVSLSLTPMLNAYLVRKNYKHSWFYIKTEPFFESLNSNYEHLLNSFLKWRWLAFVIIGGALIVMVGFYIFLPSELAPYDDRSLIRMSATAPEGSSYEYMTGFMDQLGQYIMDSVPERRALLTVTAPSFTGTGAVNTGFARLMLVDPSQRDRSQLQVMDKLSANLSKLNNARVFAFQQQTIQVGFRPGLAVQFIVQAPNFERLKEVIPKFMQAAAADPVFQGTDVNLKFNKPQLDITIDRARAASLGVNVSDVAQTLQLAYSSLLFGYFQKNNNQYQVIGQVLRDNRDQPLDLKSLYVRNNKSELIQLDNVIQMKEESSPPAIYHYNRYVSATISAGLATGKTMGDGINEMNKIASKVLDDSFSTALTAGSRDYAESSSNLGFTLILAIILVFLVLAAQFESFIDPLIIMFTVPLAFAGAFLSLWYFNQTLNIFSEIGMIMLVGLVTKNGILIVEFANQQRRKGMAKMEAIKYAAVMRLRPILMTTIATIFGAFPIALALGSGALSRRGMGFVVMGGLLIALVFTLFVIPAMYSYLSRAKKVEEEISKVEEKEMAEA
ncbi:MAG TPA: efflux RND transporter permease subunit [Chitinophagales bacterium]|nr:efflux RND transporter permease subunit [Chitinophagales bacterium]